jgi:hypothetical protein
MPLVQLIYLSSATQPFSPADLLALLETSRRNNTPVGITGLLLYRDGNFIQVLEGEEPAVSATHDRIIRDTRHGGLITLLKAPIAQRSFGEWSMGFRNLSAKAAPEVPGYNEFLNEDWLARPMQASPDRAVKLLQLFRSGLR